MAKSILESPEGRKFPETPVERFPTQQFSMFLMDPIEGTRFDRWTGANPPATDESTEESATSE